MAFVTWILDSGIMERLCRYSSHSIQHYIRNQGHRAVLVAFDPLNPKAPDINVSGPVVLYGCIPFVRLAAKNPLYTPGGLGMGKNLYPSIFMSYLPNDWFLNSEAKFMPWGLFKQKAKSLFYDLDCDRIFVRPDSSHKAFTGQCLKFDTLDHDIETLDKLTSVTDETMILYSPPQEIKGEFRFVIAEGKVITGSEYRWDDKMDIRIDYPDECFEVAKRMAENEWQPDTVYTCDVALTESGAKIVELNGFSSAGLYACNLEKVVKAVSDAARREYTGEDIFEEEAALL